MPLRISLTAPGLPQIQDALKKVTKAVGQSKIGGVELVGRPRTDGKGYEEILDYLIEGDRDFVSLTTPQADELGQAFADQIEKDLTKIFDRIRKAQKVALAKQSNLGKAFGSMKSVQQRQVDDMVGRAYKDMMAAYQAIFVDRLNSGTDWQGNRKPVGDAYATWRSNQYGVSLSAIGIATGQTLENSANPATIRVTSRK